MFGFYFKTKDPVSVVNSVAGSWLHLAQKVRIHSVLCTSFISFHLPASQMLRKLLSAREISLVRPEFKSSWKNFHI